MAQDPNALAIVKPRHSVPLNALRAFEAAARSLSFQAAAVQLFVTPAAVSHQVRHLENYLGVQLFHRGHRSVELTDAGRALASSLSELFCQLDLALDKAMAPSTADLRVTTMESFAAKWLAPRLHRFHRDYPDLKVRIQTSNELVDVARDGVHVAIRYGRGGYAGARVERLMEAPVFPVCAPSLAEDTRWPLEQPDDLQHHTLLHDESATNNPGVPDWAAWLDASGATRVDATRGPVFASIYLAQEAAVAGHGVALGVAPLVEKDLQLGRLIRPFHRVIDNAYAFWIVRPQAADSRPEVEAFCRWLRNEASGTSEPLPNSDVAWDEKP